MSPKKKNKPSETIAPNPSQANFNAANVTIDNQSDIEETIKSDILLNEKDKDIIYEFIEQNPKYRDALQQGSLDTIRELINTQESQLAEQLGLFQRFKTTLLVDGTTDIDANMVLKIQKLFTAEEQAEYPSHTSGSPYHSSLSDSDYIDSSPDYLESNILTRSCGAIPGGLTTKDIHPYVMEMMGGFEFDIRDDEVYVSASAEIRRPNKVKGNLGDIAGDHVVPFALFTRDIESKVKGQEVLFAITTLASIFGGRQVEEVDHYQYIIEKASPYTTHTAEGTTFKEKIAAFQFLRSEFIPYVTAVWNQRVGTAFKSTKTQVERGTEGAMVREMLKHLVNVDVNEASDQANIENFIKVIDYKPIEDVGQAQLLGHRNNDIQELSQVMGDVAETYCYMYQVDAKKQVEVTKKLVTELLKQHNWVDYYYNHLRYLKNDLKPTSSKVTVEFCDGLIGNICDIIARQQSLLRADALSVSSGSSLAAKDLNQGANNEYYTEDQISDLLHHYLPNEQLYYIAPQTQFEGADLLRDNVRAAIAEVTAERTAVMHINLHNNHWVGIVMRTQADGILEVIYVDPIGGHIEREENAVLLIETITELAPQNARIIDLGTAGFTQQQNGIDCGPFTVDNLVRLAQAGDQVDNLDAMAIINLDVLIRPVGGSAANLRAEHDEVLNHPQNTTMAASNASIEGLASTSIEGCSASSIPEEPNSLPIESPTASPTAMPSFIKSECMDNHTSNNADTGEGAQEVGITLDLDTWSDIWR